MLVHGDLLRLLSLLADNKAKRHYRDRHEVIDDDSEAYCWRRSGFFWRMRASLGLACAQATTHINLYQPHINLYRPHINLCHPLSTLYQPLSTSIHLI